MVIIFLNVDEKNTLHKLHRNQAQFLIIKLTILCKKSPEKEYERIN